MKVYYAVIDTNVLVSAMLSRTSTPGEIIRHLLNGGIIPVKPFVVTPRQMLDILESNGEEEPV